MSKKYRTIEQVKTAQERAVRFAENVLLDEDKAEELASLAPEEYAERKRIQIITPNPNTTERNRPTMPKQSTRAELQDRITELEEENAAMAEQLDNIAQIVSPADEDEDDEQDEDEQDDDEQDDDEGDEDE